MIHQYINNGFYIVLDVNSGSVHSVDPLLYDAIKLLSGRLADMKEPAPVPRKTAEEVAELLKEKYSADEIQEAFSDIQELIDREELFTADIYKDYVMDFKKRQTVVKRSVCTLPMTVTWPAVIVLRKRGSTTDAGR